MSKTAARSLDVPITFRVRGTDSTVSATLLQMGLGSCRMRTWRIMRISETICIDFLRQNGELMHLYGMVRDCVQVPPNQHEYTVVLDPLPCAQADILARESAALVQRRHSAA